MGTEMLLSHILLEASDEEIASEISVLYLQGYQSLCNSAKYEWEVCLSAPVLSVTRDIFLSLYY